MHSDGLCFTADELSTTDVEKANKSQGVDDVTGGSETPRVAVRYAFVVSCEVPIKIFATEGLWLYRVGKNGSCLIPGTIYPLARYISASIRCQS